MQLLLRSSPDELYTKIESFRQKTGLHDLLTLAEITNKYHFSSTEKLLVKTFHHHITTHVKHLSQIAPADDLKHALRVAILQNARNIQMRLLRIFVSRVLERTIPADVALEFGNTYSLRSLQGAAHYIYLMDNMAENEGEAAFEVIKFGQGIDEDLKVRLLRGYWSLMRTCLRLRSTPPIDFTTCEALGIAEWHKSYKFPFDSPSPDLLELLRQIKQSLRMWCSNHPQRRKDWVAEVSSRFYLEIMRVEDNLMGYFDP
jgi:hypothetical protein